MDSDSDMTLCSPPKEPISEVCKDLQMLRDFDHPQEIYSNEIECTPSNFDIALLTNANFVSKEITNNSLHLITRSSDSGIDGNNSEIFVPISDLLECLSSPRNKRQLEGKSSPDIISETPECNLSKRQKPGSYNPDETNVIENFPELFPSLNQAAFRALVEFKTKLSEVICTERHEMESKIVEKVQKPNGFFYESDSALNSTESVNFYKTNEKRSFNPLIKWKYFSELIDGRETDEEKDEKDLPDWQTLK